MTETKYTGWSLIDFFIIPIASLIGFIIVCLPIIALYKLAWRYVFFG